MLSEHVQLRETVRELLSEKGHDADLWRLLGKDLGLLGLTAPESLGGQGATLVEAGILMHEAGRVVLPGPLLQTLGLVVPLLTRAGTDEQRRRLLGPVLSGESSVAVAVHEGRSTHGADVGESTLAFTDGTLLLTGTKRFVLGGLTADTLVVAARFDTGELGLVAVEAATVRRLPMTVVDEGRPMSTVEFDWTPVELLSSGAEADEALAAALGEAAALVAAESVGVGERCLELSVEYAKTRRQFGRPIGGFQAVKHRLADMFVELELARAMAEESSRTPSAIPAAKARCGDAIMFVAREAIQVHGGIGFTWEHDLSRLYRRAMANATLFGHPSQHRETVAAGMGW